MTIKELATSINEDSRAKRWFWVYGILKETVSLWTPAREHLLHDDARIILHSIHNET